MTAKMLDVQTGTLLWAGEGTGSLKSGLATFGGALLGAGAGAVTGRPIGRGATGAVIGGVAGALGGGMVGAALEAEPGPTDAVRDRENMQGTSRADASGQDGQRSRPPISSPAGRRLPPLRPRRSRRARSCRAAAAAPAPAAQDR